MRKISLLVLAGLLLVAVSCSSSKKSTATSTSTTTKSASSDPSVKSVCAATSDFASLAQNPGSDFKADAAKLQSIATQLSTNPPADIAAAAKATAVLLQQAATKLSTASSASAAQATLGALALNVTGDKNLDAFNTWQKANC